MDALQAKAGAAQICLMQDRQAKANPCTSQKLTKNLGVLISPPQTCWPQPPAAIAQVKEWL